MSSICNTLQDINSLRRSNCYNLLTGMNLFLNNAVYARAPLESHAILSLMATIKANTEKILAICQSQDAYVPWEKVDSRRALKRQSATLQQQSLKKRCHNSSHSGRDIAN